MPGIAANKANIRALRKAAIIAAALLCGDAALLSCGFFHNPSPSVPLGFYRRDHAPDATRPPRRGDCVLVALPADCEAMRFAVASGILATPRDRLLKHVVGIPGDIVAAEGAAVTVTAADSGVAQKFARMTIKPRGGEALPAVAMRRRLGPGEYFVAGTHPASYDSRYFGPVRLESIVALCHPVLTWAGE